MAGCLLMIFLNLENLRSTSLVLNSPLPPVGKMIEKNGYDQVALVLRHLAAEQTRHYTDLWGLAEIGLALAVGGCLALATQRRVFPLVLCGIMLIAVVFQHFAIMPELGYRGRDTDFPPGNTAIGPVARMWALEQVYFSVEVVKLIAGAVLASYLFVFRASRRRTKEVDTIDHTTQGHINR
jgi:hypothetical protein